MEREKIPVGDYHLPNLFLLQLDIKSSLHGSKRIRLEAMEILLKDSQEE